jgi:hypothetical protein
MLGAARPFVFAPESRQRLPELALVAGAMLMSIAATQPAHPDGLLGSGAQTDVRPTAAGPRTGALRRFCGAA